MKTTITVNNLLDLKTVANFYGIEVKSSETAVSFPYRFENDDGKEAIDDDEFTFEEFIERNNILIF